jgi:hypothetical protein
MSDTLFGSVYTESNQAVDGATVTAVCGDAITEKTTDANGNFTFDSLPYGDYKMTATMSGYANTVKYVTVAAGTDDEVDFILTSLSKKDPNNITGTGKMIVD